MHENEQAFGGGKRVRKINGTYFFPTCKKVQNFEFGNEIKIPENSYSINEHPVFFGHY